jgi:hypothetical protein
MWYSVEMGNCSLDYFYLIGQLDIHLSSFV